MPLKGAGGPLGDALAGAVGAPSSVGGFFAKLGGVIADWAPANIQVKPGATMIAASGNVGGTGTFERVGDARDLGNKIATALDIPPDAADARETWVQFADAFLDQLETYGIAVGTGLTSGAPCGGAGKIQFSSLVFVPPLSTSVSVDDPIAKAGLEAFGTMLLNYLQTNGAIVALSLSGLPLSAPPDGAVTGTGTIG